MKRVLVLAFIVDTICWVGLGLLVGYSINAL